MPHLVEGYWGKPIPIEQFADELAGAHEVVAQAAADWASHDLRREEWGRAAKRRVVSIPQHGRLVPGGEQPFSEVVNQLATIERALDALAWALSVGATFLWVCNPTTSSQGHDLVVGTLDAPTMIFEVCDVAGPGNSNLKMIKELTSVLLCPRIGNCHCGPARRMLAVSESSARWLESFAHRGGALPGTGPVSVKVVNRPEGLGTWIIEVAAERRLEEVPK
jgi:hypothetical protein